MGNAALKIFLLEGENSEGEGNIGLRGVWRKSKTRLRLAKSAAWSMRGKMPWLAARVKKWGSSSSESKTMASRSSVSLLVQETDGIPNDDLRYRNVQQAFQGFQRVVERLVVFRQGHICFRGLPTGRRFPTRLRPLSW